MKKRADMFLYYSNTFVNTDEYNDYVYKSSKKNPIRKYWKLIIKSMTSELQKEVRNKATDLKKVGYYSEKLNIEECKFFTRNASEELKQYLDRFSVYVQNEIKVTGDVEVLNMQNYI